LLYPGERHTRYVGKVAATVLAALRRLEYRLLAKTMSAGRGILVRSLSPAPPIG
jgi:hypothetical protein